MKSHNPEMQKLGDRFKSLRLKKGYTSLEKFAFDNELSRVLYSNYESGKGNITYKNLLKVTKALDISLKDFFSEGFD
jgi:transcriptional regulator with XRE-family HTH domain